MNLKRTGSRWDRNQRININDNWDQIESENSRLSGIGKDAENTLKEAIRINDEAKKTNDMNKDVQQQINTLIAESGTSDAEVLQARIDGDGNEYPVLKERLDESDAQLAQITTNSNFTTKNLITNGDFSNGTIGWTTTGSPVIDNSVFSTPPNSLKVNSNGNSSQVRRLIPLPLGHVVYVSVKVKCTRYVAGVIGYQLNSADALPHGKKEVTSDFVTVSNTHKITNDETIFYVGSFSGADLEGNVDDVMIVDLTETFGKGNEPSKGDFELLLEKYPQSWFGGTVDLIVGTKELYTRFFENNILSGDDDEAKSTFIGAMNEKAKQIGMDSTHFLNPSGLHEDGMVTTAKDLIKMGINATGYDDLVRVWNKKSHTFNIHGENAREMTIDSTVTDPTLEGSYHIFGGKTGSAENKLNVLLLVNAPNNEWFVGAVLDSHYSNRFLSAKELFDIAISNVAPVNIVRNGDFTDGLNGWIVNSGTPIIDKTIYTSSPQSVKVSSTGTSSQFMKQIPLIIGHKYYVSINVNCTRYSAGTIGYQLTGAGGTPEGKTSTTQGFVKVSGIHTATHVDGVLYGGSFSAADLDGHVDDLMLFDLTDAFGVGNEPTLEEFENMPVPQFNAGSGAVALMPKHNPFAYENYDVPLIYGKNENELTVPASITKIMTAMILLDNVTNLDERIEITRYDIVNDGIDIKAGDIISIKDALHCMMLPSSNRVANAVARVVGSRLLHKTENK